MKIASKFQVKSSAKATDGKDLGVFADILEDTDCPAFSTANLEEESKRVAVFVFGEDEDQAPEMFLCSKRLSKVTRKALAQGHDENTIMSALLTLKVFENEKGRFIAVTGVKRDRISKKDLLARAKVGYNDLVSYAKPKE